MSNQSYAEQPQLHTKAPYRSALLTQSANGQEAMRRAFADPAKTLFGVAQGVPSVFVTKLLASTRPDFIWLDAEHETLHDPVLHPTEIPKKIEMGWRALVVLFDVWTMAKAAKGAVDAARQAAIAAREETTETNGARNCTVDDAAGEKLETASGGEKEAAGGEQTMETNGTQHGTVHNVAREKLESL
ncbi:hypothetical protein P8C59_007700 [Phyllachora maydis]|uniref:Uncharacterized protein n=1 Tax=Phyllachora maydis TaxID=1825666 RepID=A0AAD9I8X5_9PEZI|nr:hypothetical protein P8C59_007700 [Phyllachora maydis]